MKLHRWLFSRALPLWLEAGTDRINGGFFEALDGSASAVVAPRRARVIARQTYVYAAAFAEDHDARWLEGARHGLEDLLGRFLNAEGEMRLRIEADGSPSDALPMLYDQAFCLFALATAHRIGLERDVCKAAALRLHARLDGFWRGPHGGFIEHDRINWQANPQMHLFEACLAWEEVDAGGPWAATADEIANLALTRFINPKTGALHEFFNADWTRAAGADGDLVEPGHQFEWCWLLTRWSRLRGRADAQLAARRLFEVGAEQGVDLVRGVAVDALDAELAVTSARARLWPQTEWIKAAAILAETAEPGEARRAYEVSLERAATALGRYLDNPAPGLWRDKMLADGGFVDEPSPATSLYHIACAVLDARGRGFTL
jgi:mannose-6-phosphate isomerase